MLEVLKSSVIYCLLEKCIVFFWGLYLDSVLAKIVRNVCRVFQDSYFGKLSRRYEDYEPLFLYSKCYKILRKFAEKCKSMVDYIVCPFWNGKLSFVSEAKVFKINYEIVVMLAMLYAVFDWIFRQYITSLASIWDEMFLIILCLMWLYKWVTKRDAEAIKTSPFDIAIIIFIGVMIVLMLISPKPQVAFEGFRATVQSLFWYFVAFQLMKNENTVRKLVTVFVWLTGILAIHGVYQYIIGVEMPSTWIESNEVGIRTRVYSIFTSPNIFGSLMVLAIPICIALLLTTEKKLKKVVFNILALCMFASLLFTYSRGAWIGVACAMGVYVLLKDKRLIVPAVFTVFLVLIFVPSISNRILYMLSPEYMASSMKGGRLIRWLTGIQIFQEHPWIGLGLGSFGGAVAMNNGLSAIVHGKVIETFYMDNYYMKIVAEAGLVGIVVFVFLMWQVFSISLKTVRIVEDKRFKELGMGIMAGLTGVMVHCFVENIFEVPMMGVLFWVFVAAMAQLWYSNYKKQSI